MENSSKKSLRPSPSQLRQTQATPGPAGKPPEIKPQLASRDALSTEMDKMSEHQATGGAYLRVPMPRGYAVYLELRQIKIILVAVALYIFAAFAASEWIYLLSAAFLVTLLLGMVLPVLSLSALRADYALPNEVSPTESANIEIYLSKRFFLPFLTRFFSINALRLTINMAKRAPQGQPSLAVFRPDPVYIDELADDSWFRFNSPGLKRGVYFMRSLEVMTCYPLGVAFWSRTLPFAEAQPEHEPQSISKSEPEPEPEVLLDSANPEEQPGPARHDSRPRSITVYPQMTTSVGNFLNNLTGVLSPMGHPSANSMITHQSSSFRSVREFRSGDSLRHIHWRSTARLGAMQVREFDSEMLPVFDVLLNLRANYRTADQFELAVMTVNSLIHLGYSLGHMPNLILHPPFQSPKVQALMFDLPQMPPGLGLMAEILARVEPITRVAANRKSFDEPVKTDNKKWEEVSLRPLVTLLPSSEKIMKYSPGRGDIVCMPIDLLEISPDWQTEVDDRLDQGPTTGNVIGRVEWEDDLEGL